MEINKTSRILIVLLAALSVLSGIWIFWGAKQINQPEGESFSFTSGMIKNKKSNQAVDQPPVQVETPPVSSKADAIVKGMNQQLQQEESYLEVEDIEAIEEEALGNLEQSYAKEE